MTFEGYRYPLSGELIGWGLCLSSILCIPGYALWYLLRSHGTLRKVSDPVFFYKGFSKSGFRWMMGTHFQQPWLKKLLIIRAKGLDA